MMDGEARGSWARDGGWMLLCVCVLASLLPALGSAQVVPTKLRAAILLRALQYEKVFVSESSIAVIVVLSGAKGTADGAEMAKVMRQLAEGGDGGRKIRVEELSGEVSADALRRTSAAAIYVAQGNEAMVSVAASAGSAIVLCADPSLVGKGCLVAVEPAGSSSRLVVDLAGAEKKGRTFDARLLRLSRVIR
jgi:hypothetical protein